MTLNLVMWRLFLTLIRAVSVEERGEHLAGVASGKNGRREIFFFFFLKLLCGQLLNFPLDGR